jgi:effector-binding domain-containing protein
MLSVTKTAGAGIALSVPGVVQRKAAPYLAIPVAGAMMDLPKFAPQKFMELHRWIGERNVAAADFGFIRYRAFGKEGSVKLEVGMATNRKAKGDGEVVAGALPAGRYAMATLSGPYDRLYDAFCMLNGWIAGRGLKAAGTSGKPECQLELYRVSPATEADPAKWQTDLAVMLEG